MCLSFRVSTMSQPSMWESEISAVGPTGAWDPPLEVCSLETVWLLRVALGSVIEISRGQVINYVFNNVFEKPSTNNHRSKQCNRNNCSLIGNKFIKLFGTQPYEVKLQPLIGRVGFPLFSRKPPSFRHRGAGIPPALNHVSASRSIDRGLGRHGFPAFSQKPRSSRHRGAGIPPTTLD